MSLNTRQKYIVIVDIFLTVEQFPLIKHEIRLYSIISSDRENTYILYDLLLN